MNAVRIFDPTQVSTLNQDIQYHLKELFFPVINNEDLIEEFRLYLKTGLPNENLLES